MCSILIAQQSEMVRSEHASKRMAESVNARHDGPPRESLPIPIAMPVGVSLLGATKPSSHTHEKARNLYEGRRT